MEHFLDMKYVSLYYNLDFLCRSNWNNKLCKLVLGHVFVNCEYFYSHKLCYMTPIKDLLWLATTSLHWLWQILMSNSDEPKTGNITDRELKIDWTKSSPGDIKFCHTDWFLMYISQVKCFNSEFVHFKRTAFNPFMPNVISRRYQLKQSISVLRGVRWYFPFLFKF